MDTPEIHALRKRQEFANVLWSKLNAKHKALTRAVWLSVTFRGCYDDDLKTLVKMEVKAAIKCADQQRLVTSLSDDLKKALENKNG